MNWRNQMRYQSNLADMTAKLIVVNLAVYAFFMFLNLIAFLFQQSDWIDSIRSWLTIPSNLDLFITRPWTLITYAFLHAGFWHILSNMIILYFSGRFFLTFFSPKKLLNYYFLGAIAGGLFFLLSYNVFPVFMDGENHELIGASAAVMAILIGVAAKAPQMNIRFFFFNLKLWWIAAFFVGRDIMMIPIENPGGHIAHLGGAALGFLYTKQLAEGRDIGAWFEKIMDFIVGLFSKATQQNTSSPFRKVYKNKKKPTGRRGPFQRTQAKTVDDEREKQKKIDAILDKISKNGYDSLSKKEKEFLFNAGKD